MANYGLAKFRLPTGKNLSIRGSLTHNPINFSREATVNLDGSVDGSESAQGYRFGLSLAAKDRDGNAVDVAALYALDKVSFSFIHDSEKVVRTYSRCTLMGDPQVDDMTGELSGISGVAEGYLEQRR